MSTHMHFYGEITKTLNPPCVCVCVYVCVFNYSASLVLTEILGHKLVVYFTRSLCHVFPPIVCLVW